MTHCFGRPARPSVRPVANSVAFRIFSISRLFDTYARGRGGIARVPRAPRSACQHRRLETPPVRPSWLRRSCGSPRWPPLRIRHRLGFDPGLRVFLPEPFHGEFERGFHGLVVRHVGRLANGTPDAGIRIEAEPAVPSPCSIRCSISRGASLFRPRIGTRDERTSLVQTLPDLPPAIIRLSDPPGFC